MKMPPQRWVTVFYPVLKVYPIGQGTATQLLKAHNLSGCPKFPHATQTAMLLIVSARVALATDYRPVSLHHPTAVQWGSELARKTIVPGSPLAFSCSGPSLSLISQDLCSTQESWLFASPPASTAGHYVMLQSSCHSTTFVWLLLAIRRGRLERRCPVSQHFQKFGKNWFRVVFARSKHSIRRKLWNL